MSQPIPAKHLALFAENPRRYCAGELKRDDLLDNDIAAGWPGRKLAIVLLTLTLTLLFAAGILLVGFNRLYSAIGMSLLAGTLLLIAGWHFWRGTHQALVSEAQIHKFFGLEAGRYKLLNADILGNRGRTFKNDTLLGIPHSLFSYSKDNSTLHIGMLVASAIPEGGLSDRDLYRITLHMGLVKQIMKVDRISGSVRYADKILRVTHSDSLYRSLCRMLPELQPGKERGWPVDGRALHIRWQHAKQSRQSTTMIKRPAKEDWPQAYIV